MVLTNKNQPGKAKRVKRARPGNPVQDDQPDDLDPGIKEQLARAKATRAQAEASRQRISSKIMDASKRLYQTLLEDGGQALERAKKLESAAQLNMLESQRELQHAQSLRQEADSYRQQVITEATAQANEMVQQSQAIKADAVAFREKLLVEIKQQADLELDQAQSSRAEADAYRERVTAQAQRQANDILDRARLTAQQEGNEIKLRFAMEARNVLAEADLIRAAAEEQLEAQRLYADAANLQSESREVLDQARSMVNRESPLIGLISRRQSPAQEERPATADQPERLEAKSFSASDIPDVTDEAFANKSFRNGMLPELEINTSRMKDPIDPAPAETADIDRPGPTGPRDKAKTKARQTPGMPSTNPDISGLLPANELVLGIESNNKSRAYPFGALSQERIINDTVGELDILLTFGPPSELGMMFNRQLDGRSLTFKSVAKLQNGIAMMKDLETGSIWEAMSGLAINGPLADTELERLTSEYSFWFSWSQAHPTTEVYAGAPTEAYR